MALTNALPGARNVPVTQRLSPSDVLLLSIWCGLAGGLLEVVVRVGSRIINPTNRLYMMSRHFVWLTPLVNLTLFLGIGLLLALASRLWPRFGAWFGSRFVCALAVLPVFYLVDPREYSVAWLILVHRAGWLILAVAIAALVVPRLERSRQRLLRRLIWSLPLLLGFSPLVAGFTFGRDALGRWREANRAFPPAGSPNVLLIVWDTVRADRLSVYGHDRLTSPALERIAGRGIRFDQARAAAPWTLPSHANFFTGRWPHKLGVEWVTPLQSDSLTVAEYLSSHGYATAGFVANTLFCSYDSGLNRGFTHYEDYVLNGLGALRTAWLMDHALKLVSNLGLFLSRSLARDLVRPWQDSLLEPLFAMDRKKDAASMNRAFLAWLARRPQPSRPFFAFINYYDAHSPYVLPPGAVYRFGLKPQNQEAFIFLVEQWDKLDKLSVPQHYRALARDCYDNCVAYLDEQLGNLCDELQRLGVLDRTVLIVASDHGEGLGEHDLFDHGESLYNTEIHVPLVIVVPALRQHPEVVAEPVSLGDLPATIVDLVGLESSSPFPGRSLVRQGRDARPAAGSGTHSPVFSELPSGNPSNPNQGRSPARSGPLVSLAEGDFVYILNQGTKAEQLFNEREDRWELSNRAAYESMRPVLERFRHSMKRLKAE